MHRPMTAIPTEETANIARAAIRSLERALGAGYLPPDVELDYRRALTEWREDLEELLHPPCVGCGKPSTDGVCDVCHDTACGA